MMLRCSITGFLSFRVQGPKEGLVPSESYVSQT